MDAKRRRLACWAPLLFLILAQHAWANRAATATERFELADFYVSEIKKDRTAWGGRIAVLFDATGYAYWVRVGDHIGRHDGKITRIARCRVYVSELMPDGSGGFVEAYRSLRSSLQNECQNEKSIPTDLVFRQKESLPAEVAKRLSTAGLSGFTLAKELENEQFIVWSILEKQPYYTGPWDPRLPNLIVFHKKSRTVDIISGP